MPKIKTFVPNTLCFLHAEVKAPQSKVIQICHWLQCGSYVFRRANRPF